MKKLYTIFMAAMVAVGTFNAEAQVRWNPANWQVVDGGNTQLLDKDHMEVVVTPVSGKDHCHIYNAVDLTFSAEEPYLIMHFEASEGIRCNKQHSMFKFYNDFEKYNELTEEQITSYQGYVFDQTFNVDKGDGYVVYRGKYNDTDEDIFTNGWDYSKTVSRGNIWVIDLRQVPTKNGGYIFDKEGVPTFSITHTRAPWWTNVEGAPARMKSALQIELCTNVIPDGTTKAEFLTDKSIQYRYIATASANEVCKESRAGGEDIDPDKVKMLIDNYRARAEKENDYAEPLNRNGASSGIDTVTAANTLSIIVNGNTVSCNGATAITLYNITGSRVAAITGNSIEVAKGLYIVRAMAADGTTTTTKVIVK